MNRTLLDMDMKTEQANQRQRMFDNATATNQRLDHKETIQALKQKSKDEFEG